MAGCDFVFHLAANADVRFGLEHPGKDFQQNAVATFNVLEAMRANGIKGIAFSSTGSVYGEAEIIPTPENAPFPIQTSLYAASKLACEGFIHAYCEGYGFEGYIFRFVSILGERYTHGHVLDFYKQLREHPEQLKVLGDGKQQKSYLYIGDCLEAMLHVIGRGTAKTGETSRRNLQPRHGGICAGQRFHPVHFRRAGRETEAGIHRRQQGLGRRQPVHLPRHEKNPRHRLEDDADHRAEHHAHAGMAPAKPVGARTAMKIVVQGLWHLGCVTAACCAKHFQVVGLGVNAGNIAKLNEGQAPLFEPGLNELIAAGIAAKKLSFTTDAKAACADADVLWVCMDTPVNDNDESDVDSVLAIHRQALAHLPKGALVLISSQLPVGTCAKLEKEFPQFHFACSPENLRLGKAIDAFEKAERVIVGIRDDAKKAVLEELFAPFTSQILFMRTESAEMVKHALNSFLALSITFINEIARLCEHTGADAKEVAAGLKSEPRIGPKAYLGPGGPFAGGTLARDVVTLTKLAEAKGEKISVIPAIKQSNDLHRGWAFRRLQSRLGDLRGKKIAVLGLTYTTEHRHASPQRGGGIVPATFESGRESDRVRSGGEKSAEGFEQGFARRRCCRRVGRRGCRRRLHRMAAISSGGLAENCSGR